MYLESFKIDEHFQLLLIKDQISTELYLILFKAGYFDSSQHNFKCLICFHVGFKSMIVWFPLMIVWFPLCYDQSKIQRKEKKNCEKNLSCSEPPCDNVGFWAAPTSNLPYTNVQFLSICYYSRVTSLKQLSIAEFSGEYTRPKVYENSQKKVLGIFGLIWY